MVSNARNGTGPAPANRLPQTARLCPHVSDPRLTVLGCTGVAASLLMLTRTLHHSGDGAWRSRLYR
jgi:hypothetical protein